MSWRALLKNPPVDIKIPYIYELRAASKGHNQITNLVGYTWLLWIVSGVLSSFPITLENSSLETRSYPDYGTGKTYTLLKKKTRYIDFI